MKVFKTITFGMMFLFGVTVMATDLDDSSKISSVEKTEIKEACSLVYNACDDLYPNDFDGFDSCYSRGGC